MVTKRNAEIDIFFEELSKSPLYKKFLNEGSKHNKFDTMLKVRINSFFDYIYCEYTSDGPAPHEASIFEFISHYDARKYFVGQMKQYLHEFAELNSRQ